MSETYQSKYQEHRNRSLSQSKTLPGLLCLKLLISFELTTIHYLNFFQGPLFIICLDFEYIDNLIHSRNNSAKNSVFSTIFHWFVGNDKLRTVMAVMMYRHRENSLICMLIPNTFIFKTLSVNALATTSKTICIITALHKTAIYSVKFAAFVV